MSSSSWEAGRNYLHGFVVISTTARSFHECASGKCSDDGKFKAITLDQLFSGASALGFTYNGAFSRETNNDPVGSYFDGNDIFINFGTDGDFSADGANCSTSKKCICVSYS